MFYKNLKFFQFPIYCKKFELNNYSATQIFLSILFSILGIYKFLTEGIFRPFNTGGAGDFFATFFQIDPWWSGGPNLWVSPIMTLIGRLVQEFSISIYFFWFLTLISIFLILFLVYHILQLSKLNLFFFISTALFSGVIYKPLAITAFPEVFQLLLLVITWMLVLQHKFSASWTLFISSVLVKLSPFILLPILLFKESLKKIGTGLLFGLLLFLLVSYYQSISIINAITDVLRAPLNSEPSTYIHVDGTYRFEYKGMGSALARLFRLDEETANSTLIVYWPFLMALIIIISWLLSLIKIKQYTNSGNPIYLSVVFGFLSGLSIILNPQIHQHSFVALIPTIGVLIFLLKDSKNRLFNLLIFCSLLFWVQGESILRIIFPMGFSPTFFEDPIWPTILLSYQIIWVFKNHPKNNFSKSLN